MSRDKLMAKPLSKVHSKYNTPYIALIAVILLMIVIITPLYFKDGIDVFGYYGTMSSLAILVSYIFTSVGSIVYFTKKKIWGLGHTIIPILAIISLLYVLYSSVYPVPQFPNNIFPYVVLVWIALGFVLSYIFGKNSEVEEVEVETEKKVINA
jgi:amino acid transporter